jgi:hypothetical protein
MGHGSILGKNDVSQHNVIRKGNRMIDLLFSAGQALSVIGLAYGGYLSLSKSALTESASEAGRRSTPVHHVAMA